MTVVPGLVERTRCRLCQSDLLTQVLSLGDHYLHECRRPDEPKPEYSAPLTLVLCQDCKLLQLKHTVPPDYLFREYFYESGVNATMRKALAEVAGQAERWPLPADPLVCDIGSNDSTLLRSYNLRNAKKIGFEPAKNLAEKAKIDDGIIVDDYFSAQKFREHFPRRNADIVTSCAVFYDLDDPILFANDVSDILSKKGVWVVQMNYHPFMLWNNCFDNIGHEHLIYPGLRVFERILQQARTDMYVQNVEFNDVNGGSIRLYVTKEGYPSSSIVAARQMEDTLGLEEISTYVQFANRVTEIRRQIRSIIQKANDERKSVMAYGASTRGSTTLQYCGIDNTAIEAIAERNPSKWGLITSGTHIPIISEEEARGRKPDYLLVLPWQFKKEFVQREAGYLKGGGKMIFPLPWPAVVGGGGGGGATSQ